MSITSELRRISGGVDAIKEALAAKDVIVLEDARVDDLAPLIAGFSGGIEINVTVDAGSTVTATNGNKTVSGVSGPDNRCVVSIPEGGTWEYEGELNGEKTRPAVYNYPTEVELQYGKIYGVTWTGTSSPAWSRTDAAAGFTDPVPYVAGASSYGSPFDDIVPWAGMQIVEDDEAGTLVSIPKFWYKWTQNGASLTLQICNGTAKPDGYFCSPAHMDRGDGKGERDVVYVGRYHCGGSKNNSVSGQLPVANYTRSRARGIISGLGATVWQFDHAMWMTIMMLYLVEFAHWNSQEKIGYGCGNNSSTQQCGASDNMPYHTGTMQTNRTIYGVGVQYRHIEDLWGNVLDWLDGCYYNSSGLNLIKNPANFSDNSGGTSVGSVSNGYPSALAASAVAGFEYAIRPTAPNGSATTYTCDYWGFNASYPCLYVGGYYSRYTNYGLVYVNANSASDSPSNIGCRLQKLP